MMVFTVRLEGFTGPTVHRTVDSALDEIRVAAGFPAG